MSDETESKRYYTCPRAPDLEAFHVSIALLQQAVSINNEQLAAHNGYIRSNQAWQSRMDGRYSVLMWMAGLAAGGIVSMSVGLLIAVAKGQIG